MAWVIKDGKVIASAEVARGLKSKTVGLLGKKDFEGAMIFPDISSVHSFGMRFAIDVAFLDKHYVVIDVVTLKPWRIALPRVRSKFVLEAKEGAFERWQLKKGDVLEIKF
jgi:uncharacterized membrane protein (UPF0127 family)